jgi:hypothetical protein
VTPEETRKTAMAAQELMGEIAILMSEKGVDREVLFVALQMFLAHVSIQMGVSFEMLMSALAQNMPLFYQRWSEVQPKTKTDKPALVFNLDEFRKPRE